MRAFATMLAFAAFTLPALAGVKVGDRAPSFEAQFLHADAKSSNDFHGRVVLLDFWRTW